MITLSKFSNPLLILGDNPSLPGGLSRSGRDIATLCCTLPQFRVGYMGRGVGNNHKLPFTLYDYPEYGQWGEGFLRQVWEDFSEGKQGIILSTDDLSRRHWMVNPQGITGELLDFLNSGQFCCWAYVPLDSTGPNGRTLSVANTDCARRFERVLATSEWGQSVFRASGVDADWLPHGVWTDKFHLNPEAKSQMGWDSNIVVGSVMANQRRKDFPVAFECWAHLKNKYGSKLKAWLHTDELIRYWNVYALAADYGIGDQLEVTTSLTDEQLAVRYGACDCTILPTAGEGFGFPIAESLACGTLCITTDYASGSELVPTYCRIPPVTYQVDTAHNCLRAVLSGIAFANAVPGIVDQKLSDPVYYSERFNDTVSHLDWNKLKHLWVKWLLEGLK